MRFDFFITAKMSMLAILLVVQIHINVSEEHTASIFRAAPKRLNLPTIPHVVTTLMTSINEEEKLLKEVGTHPQAMTCKRHNECEENEAI